MGKSQPFLVAYDISNSKVRYKVRRILKEWRLGGQKSVHECRLKQNQAEELFLQLSEHINHETDKLLMVRLEPHRAVLFRGLGRNDSRRTLRHVK